MSQQSIHFIVPDVESSKEAIAAHYPAGQFVAIEHGRIIANAPTHRSLVEQLRVLGKCARGLRIVQAGIDYPESAVIF